MVNEAFWDPLVYSLGHSLWIGVGLALLLRAILVGLPASRYNARYGWSLVAMALLLIGWLTAWGMMALPQASTVGTEAPVSNVSVYAEHPNDLPAVSGGTVSGNARQATQSPQGPLPRQYIALLGAFWLAGVSLMACRASWQLLLAERLRLTSTPVQDDALAATFQELLRRAGLYRTVRLLENATLRSPAVAGLWRPAVILPRGILKLLPLETVRAILAHEIAHLRRYDYAVNMLQLLVEALLFFNPAMWWISRQVRLEREASCDGFACDLLEGDQDLYAGHLADAFRVIAGPAPAAAPAFADGRGTALDRIKRLLFPNARPSLSLPWRSIAGSLMLGGVFLVLSLAGLTTSITIAGRVLTPEERIEKMAALEEEYGPKIDKTEAEAVERTISATVYTPDGSPYMGPYRIHLMARTGNSSRHTSHYKNKDEPEFSLKERGQTVFLTITPEKELSPVTVGPLEMQEGGLEGLEIRLKNRFDADLRFAYTDGEPVREASFVVWLSFPGGSSTGTQLAKEWYIGEDGMLQHDGMIAMPFDLRISGPGIAKTVWRDISLSPGEQRTLTVDRSVPLKGRLVSSDSGEAVAGAEVWVAFAGQDAEFTSVDHLLARYIDRFQPFGEAWEYRSIYGNYRFSKDMYTPDAITGEDGKFEIDGYSGNRQFALLVLAEDHGISVHQGIVSDGVNTIELDAPLILSGNLSRPLNEGESLRVVIHGSLQATRHSSYSYSHAYDLFPASTGNTSLSILPLLFGSRVSIEAELNDGKTMLFNDRVTATTRGIQFNLNGTPQADTGSNVLDVPIIVRFKTPEGMPTVSGSVTVRDAEGSSKNVPVTDGLMRIEPPHSQTYWIETERLHGFFVEDFNIDAIPQNNYLNISASEAEYIVENILAAGAISGRVESPESTDSRAQLRMEILKRPESKKHNGNSSFINIGDFFEFDQSTGKFLTPALPLDHVYAIYLWDRGSAIRFSEPVELTEEHPFPEVTIPAIRDPKSLLLRVADEQGNPLPDNSLSVLYKVPLGDQKPSHGHRHQTNADGTLLLDSVGSVPKGEMSISINPQDTWQGTRIDVADEDLERGTLDIILKRGLTLRGKAVTKEGHPVSGLHVQIRGDWHKNPGVQGTEAWTDNRGEFLVRSLAEGAYIVHAFGMTAEYERKMGSHISRASGILVSAEQGTEPAPVQIEVDADRLASDSMIVRPASAD